MKRIFLVSILGFASPIIAQEAIKISKPFNPDECSVTYENSANQIEFKVIKKDLATKLLRKLPSGTNSAACTDELKASLELTATKCEVFCNPSN